MMSFLLALLVLGLLVRFGLRVQQPQRAARWKQRWAVWFAPLVLKVAMDVKAIRRDFAAHRDIRRTRKSFRNAKPEDFQ